MITYDSQWLILRYARQAQHIVYVTFAMFSKHSLVVIYRKPMRTCSRKRIIVYRKYVMFIKQSPTRFTMVTKNGFMYSADADGRGWTRTFL